MILQEGRIYLFKNVIYETMYRMSPVLTKKYNQVEKDKDIANFTC